MASKIGVALGFSILVLFGVIAIPAAVDSSNSTVNETAVIDEGESTDFGTALQIAVVESTATDVELTATNLNTGNTESEIIGEGNTTTVFFNGNSVDITAVDTTNARSTITVEYPSTFGYSDGALLIKDNLALILVSMLFVAIMGFVGVRV